MRLGNNKPSCQIHALHGFLGSPNDWNAIFSPSDPVVAHSLYDKHLPFPSEGFTAWADAFNASVQSRGDPHPILLGYSLGGRLALHCLKQAPGLWKAAIIVSAHPGFKEEHLELKIARLAKDLEWAKRFRYDPWKLLIEDWNKQPVFSNNHRFRRLEEECDRQSLALSLEHWSLAKQEDFRSTLRSLTLPILWVTGELDLLYTQIAQTLIFKNIQSKVWVAKNARHRLPWQLRVKFKDSLFEFVNNFRGNYDHDNGNTHMAITQNLY